LSFVSRSFVFGSDQCGETDSRAHAQAVGAAAKSAYASLCSHQRQAKEKDSVFFSWLCFVFRAYEAANRVRVSGENQHAHLCVLRQRGEGKQRERNFIFCLIFQQQPDLVHFSFERFLENAIREVYPFRGSPVSVLWKKKEGKEKLVKKKH